MGNTAQWLSSASFQRPLAVLPSTWTGHAPFAFWLIENHRPELLVELGTYYGFSYLCFCQQIRALKRPARCFAVDTWQGDEHGGFYDNAIFDTLHQYHEPKYGDFSRLLRSTFDDALDRFPDGSIDLLHIDGRHYYNDVKHDFQTWQRKLSSRGIVLFHDTQVRERDFGVWRLWQEISPQFPNFEFTHSYGLGVLGYGDSPSVRDISIFSQTDEEKQRIRRAYETLGNFILNATLLKRNHPCPCGSGERFKHCHGSDA